ncbi:MULTISPECIES: hypothetical protein [Streptomyces]|uniref:hypothetical protein n=1 Tax=Streptomyces TaxID=1883 RepID=UPI0032553D9D
MTCALSAESHDRQGRVAALLQEIAAIEKMDDLRDGFLMQDRRQGLAAGEAVVLTQGPALTKRHRGVRSMRCLSRRDHAAGEHRGAEGDGGSCAADG